jgi:hypothetical protein
MSNPARTVERWIIFLLEILMPQISDIVLYDGQATPVAQTFKPTSVEKDLVTLHEKSDPNGYGMIAGFPVLSISRRLPTASNGNYKVVVKLKVPIVEVPTGTNSAGFQSPSKVIATCTANLEFIIPEIAIDASKADLFAYAHQALANSEIEDIVKNASFLY